MSQSLSSPPVTPAISPTWFAPARVVGLRDITPTVREFTLMPVDAAPLAYAPGAHVQVQVLVNGALQTPAQTPAQTRSQTRSYSLLTASAEAAATGYRIAVKRIDGGRGGSSAMWRLAVGDTLPVSIPQSFFSLDLTASAYLLIAGGIGITPLLSMVQQLVQLQNRACQQGRPVPSVTMLFGARSVDELAYQDVLRAALGDALTVYVGGAPVDFEAAMARLPPDGQVYTCGPVPMLEAVKAAWAVSARPVSNLRYETFGSSGKFAALAFCLNVPRHGVDITVGTDSTLLEAMEAAGIACLSDCRRGECGLCVTDVIRVDGEIDHRDVFLSDAEKRSNQRVCICVSRAVGTLTLDSAYRPDAQVAGTLGR